jgi:hypothetical protein
LSWLDSVRFVADVPSSFAFSGLSHAELESLLVKLLGEVAALKQIVSEHREEIARLKGLKGPPDPRVSIEDRVLTLCCQCAQPAICVNAG